MCNPVALAAITVATSGYGLYRQREAAKRNERFNRAAQQEKDRQSFVSRSREATDRARRARAERARLRAISAETGLAGVTTDSILRNVDFQAGQDIARIDENLGADLTNSRFAAQSGLNAIQQPDYIGTALNTGIQLYNIREAADPDN